MTLAAILNAMEPWAILAVVAVIGLTVALVVLCAGREEG